jgi:xanthine dehydrogenase YagR molybdenum-binding subunit
MRLFQSALRLHRLALRTTLIAHTNRFTAHSWGAIFAEVPVNADIHEIDVTALNIPDYKFNSLGSRGIGEIGITGAAAAISSAVYNATGKRVRDLPITLDKIMRA